MARRLPKEVTWTKVVLTSAAPWCGGCGRRMHVKKHRQRRVYTLAGPVCYVSRLLHCPHRACPNHRGTVSPDQEVTLAMPRWLIGWDVFCWLGHRRFARHWSVPQLRAELWDRYTIGLSEDAIEEYLQRYQCMVAARQQDFEGLKKAYARTRQVVLSIDGLQPEKGHETLYVVRELGQQRVWFATPLLSSATEEIRPLIVQAKDWADRLGCRVRVWISDKQEAFVTTIASVSPGVPHRYCSNHFLRDLAKAMLELDSHAKVQMRSKIRGLRAIERTVLRVGASAPAAPDRQPPQAATSAGTGAHGRDVVLDYCAAVRSILNDSQGGPLRPPGLRMAEALGEVRKSLGRNLRLKKGGPWKRCWRAWPVVSTRAGTWWERRNNKSHAMSSGSAKWTQPWTRRPTGARTANRSTPRWSASCCRTRIRSASRWAA